MSRFIKSVLLLSMAAVTIVSCTDKVEDDGDKLTLMFDRNVISNDGTDAVTFKVVLGDQDVTSEARFFDEDLKRVEEITSDFRFVSTSVGDYHVRAAYGSLYTDYAVVKVIDKAIPDVAEDPEARSTDFVHRVFLNQFTGTDCQYCPFMTKVLLETPEVEEKAVWAAVHSRSASDPAYISNPAVGSYPLLRIDFMREDSNYQSLQYTLGSIINEMTAAEAPVGISANPAVYAEDNIIVVTVAVKAAVAGEYNLGLWLLQDNIYGQQSGAASLNGDDHNYNYHNNCVRILDANGKGNNQVGYPLGRIKAGEYAKWIFILKLKPEWWKKDGEIQPMNPEDLHMAVYVTTGSKKGYYVVNAADCSVSAPTPFEYKD